VLSALAGKATAAIADSEVDRLIKDKVGGSLIDKAKGLLEKIGN